MVAVGKIQHFDDARGYGFIAPDGGGEDVFVHANDLGEQRHLVYPGARVEYEVEEGDRGLKVSMVRLLDTRGSRAKPGPVLSADDDGLCDVLAPAEFTREITEMLIRHVPSLTGAQITQIREQVVALGRTHGWIET